MPSQYFWDDKYKRNDIGWDLGQCSPVLKFWIDSIQDKTKSILIPGAGNAYELDYLLEKGFSSVTIVDISKELISRLKQKYLNEACVNLIQGDFFDLKGCYDIILEQTFFCAINPDLREKYVEKMNSLLVSRGLLLGVLFNKEFEGGPPFGGTIKNYKPLFQKHFSVEFESCSISIPARLGNEILLKAQKNS